MLHRLFPLALLCLSAACTSAGPSVQDLADSRIETDQIDSRDIRNPADLAVAATGDGNPQDQAGTGTDGDGTPVGDAPTDADTCAPESAYAQSFDGPDPLAGLTVDIPVPPYPDQPALEPPTWSVSEQRSHSAPASLYFGYPDKLTYHNGHRVAAKVTTPNFPLDAHRPASVVFWLYLDVEQEGYSDYLTLSVVRPDTIVPVWAADSLMPQKQWVSVEVDLSPFAGETVALAFGFDSWDEHENSGEGIYLDDLEVSADCQQPACNGNTDCQATGTCISGECVAGICLWQPVDSCCLTPAECEDWDSCTLDQCLDGTCHRLDDPDPDCCNVNTDCPEAVSNCTNHLCRNGRCAALPSGEADCCDQNLQCDDSNDCTQDMCVQTACVNQPICCQDADDCDDGEELCTADLCVAGLCKFVETGAPGCCAELAFADDFEDGNAQAWQFAADLPTQLGWVVGDLDSHSGQFSLVCHADGLAVAALAVATLPVPTVPQEGAVLSFWLKADLPDTGECQHNRLTVTVNGIPVQEFCSGIANWYHVEIPIANYAGEPELALSFKADPPPGQASWYMVAVDDLELKQQCCTLGDVCDDDDPCTVDLCPGAFGICQHEVIPGCCTGQAQCDDQDSCTGDVCRGGLCSSVKLCCLEDLDCEDGEPACTQDICQDGQCWYQQNFVPGCCETEVYVESFEAKALPGWTLQNESPDYGWRVTKASAAGGMYSLYYGDQAGLSYGDDNQGTALTPFISVPPGAGASLTWVGWWETEANYDELQVVAKGPDGDEVMLEVGGSSAGWQPMEVDLGAFQGQAIQLAFKFSADKGTSSTGVFLDNLAVTVECCQTNQDCDDKDPCSEDSCPGQDGYCQHVHVPGCCQLDLDCDDADPCTADECEAGICVHLDQCCQTDLDCDDDEPCTDDLCVAGVCAYLPTGTPGCCDPEPFADGFDDCLLTDYQVLNLHPIAGWHATDVVAKGGLCALAYSNAEATSYMASSAGEIITPEIEIPLDNASPALTFFGLYDTEECCDFWSVHLLQDFQEELLGTYSGTTDSWQHFSFDLVGLAGEVVRFKLSFESDGSQSKQGVFIDDLAVVQACCIGDEDCDDGDPCTWDACPGTGAFCAHQAVLGCCVDDVQCDDEEACTLDQCQGNQCANVMICCLTDDDCTDSDDDPCTTSTCPGPGTMCQVVPVPGCCGSSQDCDDGNFCTVDSCVGNECVNVNAFCCEADADCDAGDPVCAVATCDEGLCKYVVSDVPGCCQELLFKTSFEDGELGHFLIENGLADEGWHLSDKYAVSESYCLTYAGVQGENYGPNSSGHIQTAKIQVPGSAHNPVLTFWARLDTEKEADKLKISVVHFPNTVMLAELSGQVEEWTWYSYSLDQFAGETIRVEFRFDSDSSIQGEGIFLDDVTVARACCQVDGDCGNPNPCTEGTCPGPDSTCQFEPVAGCCLDNSDCPPPGDCSAGKCLATNECFYFNSCCANDGQCDDLDDQCTMDVCEQGTCLFQWTGAKGCCHAPLFQDDFSASQGWTMDATWEIGPAAISDCVPGDEPYFPDPATDHTGSADNKLAGVVPGGCAPAQQHDYYYLTSPVIDAKGAHPLYLAYWRWLNSDYTPYMKNVVEVFDGGGWVLLWQTGGLPGFKDTSWAFVQHDVSAHAGPLFQVRFGYRIDDAQGYYPASSWNIDDVQVFTKTDTLCCNYAGDCQGFGLECVLGACQ